MILANLDRLAYGMPPLYGLNAALREAAERGVLEQTDPVPPIEEAPWYGFGSDWASAGALISYYLWMYDDGWPSGNLDCTGPGAPGCWGHRQVILEQYGASPLLLGAASGSGPDGFPGSR